jgi:hypothetical protein
MREAIENIISENKIKIDEIIKSKIGENPYDFINPKTPKPHYSNLFIFKIF